MKAQSLHIDLAQGIRAPVDGTCVGLGEGLPPETVLGFALEKGLRHACQKDGHAFDRELESTDCMIESPDSYREFPIATVLTPSDLSVESERALISAEYTFDSSQQKREVLDGIAKAMQIKGLSQTLCEDIVAAADELFTNAIYNAPFVDMLTHKNPGISRHNTEVKLEAGKFARMVLAHDEGRLVLVCEDPYGSLEMTRFLSGIRSSYMRGPAATINFGPGGAGIGSYIIYRTGSSLYFGVWPGHKTILCCVVPLGLSNRKRAQLPKHLHWIQR